MKKKKKKVKHIALVGNIGAGKTTWTQILANFFGWFAMFEAVEGATKAYLKLFYGDMKRYSFNLQIKFLNVRFNQILRMRKSKKPVIQDRTIYEDPFVFALNLYKKRKMTKLDFDNYMSLFDLMKKSHKINHPDLVIFLRGDVPILKKQIKLRGRKEEQGIKSSYLRQLNKFYEDLIAYFKEQGVEVIEFDVADINHGGNNRRQYVLDTIGKKIQEMENS